MSPLSVDTFKVPLPQLMSCAVQKLLFWKCVQEVLTSFTRAWRRFAVVGAEDRPGESPPGDASSLSCEASPGVSRCPHWFAPPLPFPVFCAQWDFTGSTMKWLTLCVEENGVPALWASATGWWVEAYEAHWDNRELTSGADVMLRSLFTGVPFYWQSVEFLSVSWTWDTFFIF